MPLDITNVFHSLETAVLLKAKRAEMLSTNIANADTPGYKPKDLDFVSALKKAKDEQKVQLDSRAEQHFSSSNDLFSQTFYRSSNQPDTGDKNSVDLSVERNLFLQNSLEYQFSVARLNGAFSGLKKAINGTGS